MKTNGLRLLIISVAIVIQGINAQYIDLSKFSIQNLPTQDNPLVPFNPIINPDNGSPLYWNGQQRQGIVGWLDVPAHDKEQFDRVLALKNAQGLINYIHPADPDAILPKGIFCWQSQWKDYAERFVSKNYKGLIHDYQALGFFIQKRQLRDFDLKQQPTGQFVKFEQDKDRWFWKQSGTNYTSSPYAHPSKTVDNFFQWIKTDAQHYRLLRPWAFYAVMGVTERYLREFFGANQKELFKPARNRQGNLVPMPSIEQVKMAFPINSKFFPNRGLLMSFEGPDYSLYELVTVKTLEQFPLTQPTTKGSVTLLDGYAIYETAKKQMQSEAAAQEYAKKQTDIRYWMAHPFFNGATVMSASNWNGLEGDIGLATAMTSDMLWRPSQGEEIALATMGGAIFRKYYYKPLNMLLHVKHAVVKDGTIKKLDVITQQEIPNIGILSHNYVPVTSGYYKSYSLTPPKNTRLKETKNDPNAGTFNAQYLATNEPNVKEQYAYIINNFDTIGWRDPINIFNGALKKPGHIDTRQDIGTFGQQKIHLALCAALDLSKQQQISPQLETTAINILKAMYLGTLYAAKAISRSQPTGPRRVILTLLGAGAFRNKIEWIAKVLNSDDIAAVIAQAGLEVYIVNFPDFRTGRKFSDQELNTLRNAVQGLQQKVNARYQW